MPMDAEVMADRRRLRRKLSFWRICAFAVAILAVVGAGLMLARKAPFGGVGAQIARISIGGFIAGDQRMTDLFKQVGDSPAVSGVVISISSPGGTTTGSEELYRGIRQLAARKPLVAFVDGTAASGAYITALGADHIVARETSIVGSIGVLLQFPNFAKLLDTVGVQMEEIKSSPLKAEPSGFKATSPEARAALQSVIDNTYGWFKRLVADRRKLDEAELASVSDGRIFSGLQAVPLKLVDELGGEREAIAWLERDRGVAANLPVRDWKPRRPDRFQLWSLAAFGADLLGFDGVAAALKRAETSVEFSKLDGLLAVWHPGLTENISSELR